MMSIEKRIKEFVNKTKKYEIYDDYVPTGMEDIKCLGVRISEGESMMDFLCDLTEYLDECGVEDNEFELEGTSYDCMNDDTIVYFPSILR